MAARESESLVLRTYPFREADLIVSFIARDQGKLRGVARGARRLKSRFGAGLERLSHVRMFYFQRDNRELVSLDSCELIDSQLSVITASLGAALDYLAEVSDRLLPDQEANDRYFRLLLLVLDYLRGGARAEGPVGSVTAGFLWPAMTYFSLWAVKLGGWLPDLTACAVCGAELGGTDRAYFARQASGLLCARCRPSQAWTLAPESRAIAGEMLRSSLRKLDSRAWDRNLAADLRQFLLQRLEEHLERRLITAPLLAEL